jgi:mannosylglucosylglycerate synthase
LCGRPHRFSCINDGMTVTPYRPVALPDHRPGSEPISSLAVSAPAVCFVSARLGEPDGVSVSTAAWMAAFEQLGFVVRTVAGEGDADFLVPGLALEASVPPSPADLDAAFKDSELVVVENLCSLPLNLPAARVVAGTLRGRRTILHHHDFPWQREGYEELGPWPPDDPAWVHVCINELSRRQLSERGLESATVYNGVLPVSPGSRERARRYLGLAPERILLVQPTRAIARKNVPAGLRLAEAIGAAYWLTGPAEDGYGSELRRVLAAAACEVHHGIPGGLDIADAYEAADAVVFPSTWEGFGLPLIEAAQYRKPVAVGRFPIVDELAAFGFHWFPSDDPGPLLAFFEDPEPWLLEHNHELAERHFSVAALAAHLAIVMDDAGLGDLITTPAGGGPTA